MQTTARSTRDSSLTDWPLQLVGVGAFSTWHDGRANGACGPVLLACLIGERHSYNYSAAKPSH